MDHQRIYNEIINRAQDRVLDVNQYYESHHVIPKCMGGTDDILNKISLTYREHFVAHWLLSLIYPDNRGLVFAFKLMAYHNCFSKSNRLVPSSRSLEQRKIDYIKLFKTDDYQKQLAETKRLNKLKRKHKMTRGERSFLSKWDPENLVSIDKMLN